MSDILLLSTLPDTVITAQIKGEVEGTVDPLQLRRVFDQKLRLYTGFVSLLPGNFDGARGKIHAGHLPAGPGKGDDVCPGATSNVDRTRGFVVLDEIDELWRADACIPWRLPKIPILEKETTEQVLHV